MDANVYLKGLVKQASAEVYDDGGYRNLRMTRLGQLLTADWKQNLIQAGLAYSAHIGTLTAGADVGLITGGGNGTTIDSDQPEVIIGVDVGQYLIPLEIDVVCNVDLDANAEQGSILAFADRTQAPPTSVAGTPGIVTPNNLLDGGAAFNGRAFGGITTDITDPVMSELLDYDYISASEFVSNGAATNLTNGITVALKMKYRPELPSVLAGPCSLVICFGGTAAVTGMAIAKFAAVPSSWFA